MNLLRHHQATLKVPSAPEDARAVGIELVEELSDVLGWFAIPVALELRVPVGPVEGPLVALLHVAEPGDRRARPLGPDQIAPRWPTVEDREVDLAELQPTDSAYLAAVRDHLSVVPVALIRLGRKLGRPTRR